MLILIAVRQQKINQNIKIVSQIVSVLRFGNVGARLMELQLFYTIWEGFHRMFFYSRRKGLRTKDQTEEVYRQWNSK